MSKPKNIDYSALDENNTRGQGFESSNPSQKSSELQVQSPLPLAELEAGLAQKIVADITKADQNLDVMVDKAIEYTQEYASGNLFLRKFQAKMGQIEPVKLSTPTGSVELELPELPPANPIDAFAKLLPGKARRDA